MSTYTAKIEGIEHTFSKISKADASALLHALSAVKHVRQSWKEINGVIGQEERTSTLTSLFGDGEGTIANPEKYAADYAALLGELPEVITKEIAARFITWANEIYKEHLPIVDKRETPEQHTAKMNEREAMYKKQDNEREASKRAFAAKYAESVEPIPTPEGMQAVCIELNYDDSDSMTDYFDRHHSYGETMVIGYLPKNARRTEANARQFVAKYPELATLEWNWNTENYSMGHGNWLSSNVVAHAEDIRTYGGHSAPALWWEVSQDGGYSKAYLPFRGFTQANSKPAPKPEAPKNEQPRGSASFDVQYDRDWTWIKFSDKPADDVLSSLKNAGGRWSVKRFAWYFTKHVTPAEIGLQ